MKTIKFDLETAKKIQAGEIKGRIITKGGKNARIICFDKRSLLDTPIVALISKTEIEELYFYSKEGEHLPDPYPNIDLVLEVPDNVQQFKPFDKVLVRNDDKQEWWCAIFSHIRKCNDGYEYACNPFLWRQCIPYEGNECLLGTTDKPKEE